jgi:hypothetical protein
MTDPTPAPGALQLMADYTELDIVQIAADQGEAVARVQALHQEVMYRDMAICAHCSAWDGPGCDWTEKPPVTYPCATITALTGPPAEPPRCARCKGRGVVPDWTNWDAYHGEPKPKPCPDCGGGADGVLALDQTCATFSEHGWGRCVEPLNHAGSHMYRPPTAS